MVTAFNVAASQHNGGVGMRMHVQGETVVRVPVLESSLEVPEQFQGAIRDIPAGDTIRIRAWSGQHLLASEHPYVSLNCRIKVNLQRPLFGNSVANMTVRFWPKVDVTLI